MDFEKYNDKFLKEYLQFNKHKHVIHRTAKLHRITEDTSVCPECGATTELDREHMELYCKECGLIVKASIAYVGVCKINYPYGILL